MFLAKFMVLRQNIMDCGTIRNELDKLGVKPEQWSFNWIGCCAVVQVGIHTYPLPMDDKYDVQFAEMIAIHIKNQDTTEVR